MSVKKVTSGALIWSTGILIPLLYHALLMHAAVQEDGYGYSYLNMVRYFLRMSWPVWLYMIAMAVTGTSLVISGFKDQR